MMGGRRWYVPLAPQARGHVPRRIVGYWRAEGWHVHLVGQAAYVHSPDGDHHLILGVWDRTEPPPAWAGRLGRVSAGYVRRWDRRDRETRWRRLARDAGGRFLGLMQWWRWPGPELYSWDRP